jgi:HEAT repeat protein
MHYLDDAQAPTTIHNVLARRRDVSFLRHLLKRIDDGPSTPVKANLRRIESFTWLRDDLSVLSALHDDEQRGAVRLALASGMNRLGVFEVLKYILQHGGVPGRRAAAEALVHFKGAEANDLIVKAVHDEDTQVQTAAVRQLRERGIPGAMAMLLDLSDSSHETVREAARTCLKEYRFDRYLETFDTLDKETRFSTGQLVKRVDPYALPGLVRELNAFSRNRRLRGVEMAVAMGAIPDVEAELIKLTSDEDHFLRTEVLRALAHSDSPNTRSAIRALLRDPKAVVQEAAEQVLQGFAASSGRAAQGDAAGVDKTQQRGPSGADHAQEVNT